MKIEIHELIEMVKDEFLCYEDMEKTAIKWETEFMRWMNNPNLKKKDLVAERGKQFLKIRDEDEIFEIADSYLDAIEERKIKQYWWDF